MLTITIIFSLLVALWGHWSAITAARAERDSRRLARADRERPPPPMISRGH
jgi:outer membrane protein TolC